LNGRYVALALTVGKGASDKFMSKNILSPTWRVYGVGKVRPRASLCSVSLDGSFELVETLGHSPRSCRCKCRMGDMLLLLLQSRFELATNPGQRRLLPYLASIQHFKSHSRAPLCSVPALTEARLVETLRHSPVWVTRLAQSGGKDEHVNSVGICHHLQQI
jgi:hypothetical protein